MPTVNQPSVAPTRKVTTGVVAGTSIAVVVAWTAEQFGYPMPVAVAVAWGAIFSQVVSYFTKERG